MQKLKKGPVWRGPSPPILILLPPLPDDVAPAPRVPLEFRTKTGDLSNPGQDQFGPQSADRRVGKRATWLRITSACSSTFVAKGSAPCAAIPAIKSGFSAVPCWSSSHEWCAIVSCRHVRGQRPRDATSLRASSFHLPVLLARTCLGTETNRSRS
jgi:hypothetical protein